MKCIDKSNYCYDLDPHHWMHYCNYEEFEYIPTKSEYMFSYSITQPTIFDKYENLVVNWYDEPNGLVVPGLHDTVLTNDKKIYKLLTPCRFSVECYNKMHSSTKWTTVFYPFNPANIPKDTTKIYDVYYTGNIYSPISGVFSMIENYNPCFVCWNYGAHRNVSYSEKISLNAKSKISITHGLLHWPSTQNHVVDMYPDHKGFELAKSHAIVPQFKTRNLEAAASKSLILCFKDPWNMIEEYFTPDVDFLYWTSNSDLEEKIKYILSHYDEYTPMINNAYNKLINNFTTRHYFDTFLRNL